MFILTNLKLSYLIYFLSYLVIIIYIGLSDLQKCTVTKKIALNFIRWIQTVSEDE